SRSVVTRRAEDVFVAVLQLEPGGILATLDNSRATSSRSGRIEVVGRDGQLVADHVYRQLKLVRGHEQQHLPVPAPVPTVRLALSEFARAVRDGQPVPIPLEEGLKAVEAVALIRAALEAPRA
ncbi:MAG: hypothetical protein JSV80_10790, partial [Acidobacteriota bacterium]